MNEKERKGEKQEGRENEGIKKVKEKERERERDKERVIDNRRLRQKGIVLHISQAINSKQQGTDNLRL